MAKKKKGMFGVSDDAVGVGTGILLSMVVSMGVNKMVGHGHGRHEGGTAADGMTPADGGGIVNHSVSDYIGEISARMGVPKPMVVKAGIGAVALYAAENMPQYRTPLLFLSGVMFYEAITSHQRVRNFMGMHGSIDGISEIKAIEDELKGEFEAFKKMNGTTLADSHMDGTTLAAIEEQIHMSGGDTYGMGATNQFSALGL
jgi:hypothetical protein